MKAAVFLKAQDGDTRAFEGDRIVLDAPSVVQLQLGPEQVARFERDGNDLVLVLEDGTVLVIENFFVQTPEGRNDLVFEDGADVTWWAQYGETWTGFDIAEISDPLIAPLPWWPLAGLLGGVAAAAAAGPSNTDPEAVADPVETPEDTPVSGVVIGRDKDGDDLTYTVTDGPTHGSVVMNPDGSYTYTPDPDYNGPDSFEVTVDDGNGGTAVVTVPVTVIGVNDDATITGDASGAVTEAGGVTNAETGSPTTGGALSVADVDSGDAVFLEPDAASLEGVYGDFTFDPETGVWTYTLDNDRPATQALTDGEQVTETLEVTSRDGTASETITVTVTGSNDVPVVTDGIGAVTEDVDVDAGLLSTSGTITADDADAGESAFDPATLTFTGSGAPLGALVVGADGNWTFTVDNTLPAVQELAEGDTIVQRWTVTSADGTATSTITVTINGANDLPEISGDDASGAITEAGGVDNADTGSPKTGGTLIISDADSGEAAFREPEAASLEGVYGDFTFDAETGEWSYTIDNDRPATQALTDGEQVTETLEVTSLDGTTSKTITVTVTGSNDVPVVTDDSDAVTEDVDVDADNLLSTSGSITIDDADAGESAFDPDTLTFTGGGAPLGALVVGADGNWTFTVDNRLQAVQELAVGESIVQSWTVKSADGTATSTITVTINGANDQPEISGAASGNLTEGGAPTATGQLEVADVDLSDDHSWQVEDDGAGSYGELTIDGAGAWTYTLDPDNPAVGKLGEGEKLTETFTVQVSDGKGGADEQVITITITGVNDAPVISTDSDLTATVTELADGDADENSFEHVQTGTITVSDPDAGDTLSVDVAPQGADYLGEFTYGDIDPVTGEIEWSFSVDDSVLDRLGPDDVLIQEYEVTVTDALGAKTTETVTVTINGSNDRPEPEDDVSLIPAGGAAVLDVRNNDADVDEGQSLTVTEVDGQPILPGGSVTLTDGSGSVSMSLDGALRFVPADGVTGAVVVSYKVDDGSGAANATAGAQWVINIASVDITDDASPADAGASDDVLSSVDDLENVVIGGKAPAGGSVTSLTVSDGVNSVTVPADGITVRPDGTYEVTADLSGLSDGTLTVTAQIEDAGDRSVTTTDTILKDTRTTVTIDPVLIEAGSAPTVTGTGEPGATITLDVNGDSYEVEVDEDGIWSVTLDGPLSGTAVITADAVDKYGNTAEADRSATGVEITDEAPGAEHVLVQESGLPGGSNPGTGQAASSTFVLSSAAALSTVVIGGAVSGGAISGGTKISLAELQTASAMPVVVTDANGTLTITGYDAATGVISYTYTLTDTLDSHSDATRHDTIVREIQVAVIEDDGDIRVELLGVGIVDDAPAAPVDEESVTVTEGGAAVGSASGGANLLANDVLGADGGRVHQITYDNREGDSTTATVPEGSSVTVETQYGTLTVGSDGSWSYTPLPSLDHDEGDGTVLRDDFTYSTIDGDGDVSGSSATQPIVVGDTVPELGTPDNRSIDEASLATGSNPNPGALEVSGSLDLTAGRDSLTVKLTTENAPSGLTAGGVDVRYVLSPDGHTLTAVAGAGADPVFIVRLTDPTSADAGYTFELLRPLDHGVAAIDLTFGVEVTDADDDKDTAEFTVTVADDVPESTVRLEMDEDGDGVSYNISADATAENTVVLQDGQTLTGTEQPDGSVQYQTEHGVVTISASGVFDFVPAANFSGDEVFVVSTTDDDAGRVDVTVTVAVTPVADAPTVSTDDRTIGTVEDTAVALGLNRPIITDAGTGDGNNPQSEALGLITLSGLPAGATLLWGSESLVVDASGTVSISLSDYAGAQLPGDPDASMTMTEFEALQVLPPANASANFEVTYSVTSYEVDGGGAPIGAGATSSAKVMVYVQADTDPATLVFDTAVDAAAVDNADAIVFDGNTVADVTLKEDTSFDLSQLLSASFTDLDGSEIRSITITNNADSVIMVAGEPLAVGASVTIPAGLLSGSTDGLPQISIGGPRDFSGDLEGITVTLNAQDKDADGYLDSAVVVPGVADGLPEADRTDNSVTLNLYVTPVADDVVAEDAQGEEDSQIAFLAGVGLSDTSAGTGGTEVITAISFEVPDGWQVTASAVENAAATGAVIDHTGSTYTISFTSGTEAEREAYLDGFTILPPAHDSRDAAIELQISTRDSAVVNGDAVENEKTATHTIDVTVTPVAEKTTGDTDDNGSPDVGMTPGFLYETPAEEDTWFALNSDGFSPAAGWSNEDAGEETYARLEPMQVLLDGTTTPAIGSQFRWTEGGEQKVAVFNGTTIDVPVSALGTLEFQAAENFSGQFTIKVQAYTVDTDDDGDATSTAVSGEAFLTNVLITPSADEVTLSLVARTQGDEDTSIPLTIHPTSSDPSETFNVTISDIPDGAVLTYNGVELVLTGGSVTIEDFDSSAPLSILPPPDSNETIDLTVSSVSVDRMEVRDPKGGTKVYTDISDPITLGISIDVRGVADEAEVTATPQTYVEGNLDGGAGVLLSELVSVDRTDIDGSETLTVQVTGLPEGFGLNHGTLLTGPGITGEDRIWALSEAQLETAGLTVPANFSGSVAFSVIPVTTEDDGASRTGTAHPVSFTVTPTPEATVTTGVTLVEDALQPLTLGIVPQNGDADEILEAVLIRVADVEAGDFSLFLGATGSEVPLAEAGLMIVLQGGVDYYQLTGEQVAQLSAQGAPHLDGALGGFDLLYKITDPGDGTVDPVTSDWTPGRFELSASPATDQPELSIGSITTDGGSVNETAVTVAEGGEQVTVNLNVASPDSDGSEAVIRVIIEGVPAGVAVEGAELAGDGLWLLIYEGGSGPAVNDAGGLTLPVVFTVSEWAGGIEDAPIRITVQTQDRGNEDQPGTEVLSDTIEWSLTTTFEPGSAGQAPVIDVWDYTDARATEDASFTLSEMIEAQVTAQDNIPAILTIALSGLPDQTVVSGMVSTIVNGAQVWTASVITEAGDTPADVQAKLDALMDSIEITPAADANDNNLDTPFSFDAVLTSTSLAGGRPNAASVEPEIPVTPVTDPAAISIVLGAADADGLLTEGDSEIPLSVTVSNPADGASGMIEGGLLYLQIGGSNGSGVLTLDGEPVTAQTVSGVEGIPDGAYYVIDGVTLGSPLDLVFAPYAMMAGELTVDAWVRNIETGATAITSTGNVTLPVAITNDGASLQNPGPISGIEASASNRGSLIELNLGLAANDADGSEVITKVLLSNLPEGFLIYTGTSQADATMATNAGGVGGLNTWVLLGEGGSLPPYIALLPPKHWSGTLDDLTLIVTSGETALSQERVDELQIGPVTITPVADGIELTPTNSFGREGDIVPLNLNASMTDFKDASVDGAPDGSVESVTLALRGLGEHASFYIGTTIVTSGISYDEGTDTYTLTGLSQSDVDGLGVRQAASALTDTDAGEAGVQIEVTAHTRDGSDVSDTAQSTVTLNLNAQLPTTGDDRGAKGLIWTGNAIDGLAGEDTVQFRYGESLTGAELAQRLRNIETLDLGIEGRNAITDLTPDQVLAMTDSDNRQTITGSTEDEVSLSGDWTDLGNGSYSGIGAGGVEVVLTVENVTVNMPVSGFSAMMMSFAAPEEESFGLASLGQDQPSSKAPAPSDPVSYEELLMSDPESEDLLAGLPEEKAEPAGGGEAASEPDPSDATSGALLAQTLEDELNAAALHEV